jgi:hypothetical protein
VAGDSTHITADRSAGRKMGWNFCCTHFVVSRREKRSMPPSGFHRDTGPRHSTGRSLQRRQRWSGEPHETNLEADLRFDILHVGRVSVLLLGHAQSRSHHCLPRAGKAEYQQALPDCDEHQWDTRLANREMNIDQFCTDAITACALAQQFGSRLASSVSQVIGVHRSSNAVSRFACTRGATCRTHQSATEPVVRCRECFRSTAGGLAFGSGDWTIETVGQRPLPVANLPMCQQRELSTKRLC